MANMPIPRLIPRFRTHRQEPSPPPEIEGDTWTALMVAAQAGHGGAYQRLLCESALWLKHYFSRRLPFGDVDDAVQETLLAVHRRRHTYDPHFPFRIWLSAIARNKWIDQLRSMGRRPWDELSEDIPVDDHERSVTSASILGLMLAQLRPAQAQAIRLTKLEGYSIEEASRETGQSISATKMNIHRGLARLIAIIEKTSDVD